MEEKWDWGVGYPTMRFSFDTTFRNVYDLEEFIKSMQDYWAELYNVKISSQNIGFRNIQLVEKIFKKTNKQIVLLVDEYDKPILDNIENPELALQIRDILKGFYQTIKPLDRYLKFVFITGISKFAKVSLFSGLNQLRDISLSRDYSTICGYTQQKLLSTFGHLINSQEELQKIQEWYNGYSWNGETLYNPFDILLYLQERQFLPFWFETGTPSFLIKILQQKQFYIPQLERTISSEELLTAFDIEYIEPEALLFQTGYLTIKDTFIKNQQTLFTLSYPNFEVKLSLNSRIASLFTNSASLKQKFTLQLIDIFDNSNFELLPIFLNNLFAQIPFQWYTHTSQYEVFYCTVFYIFLVSTGLNVIAEDTSSTGNIDLTVLHQNTAYIFEFKVDKGQTIQQILSKQYYNKYLNFEKIFAIGILINSSSKSVQDFKIQQIK